MSVSVDVMRETEVTVTAEVATVDEVKRAAAVPVHQNKGCFSGEERLSVRDAVAAATAADVDVDDDAGAESDAVRATEGV